MLGQYDRWYQKYHKTWSDVRWITGYLDVNGILGEVNGLYTLDDLRAIWDSNNDTDPCMEEYGSADAWMCDTIGFMDEVEIPVV